MASTYDVGVTELTEASPRAAQPEECKVEMMPHQLTLLHRCRQYENEKIPLSSFPPLALPRRTTAHESDCMETHMGIIGDAVGAGKSFVILGLVASDGASQRTGPSVRSYGFNQMVFYTHDRHTRPVRTTLLVIPHNLVTQWAAYIRAFSDDIKFLLLHRTRALAALQEDGMPDAYDLIVVTNTLYNQVAAHLESKSIRLRRVVYDEADELKIQSCAAVDADFTWFVTASYGNLLWPRGHERWDPVTRTRVWHATGVASSGYIKKLFIDLDSGLSKDGAKMLVVRNQHAFVQRSMQLPPVQTRWVECKMSATLRILNGVANRDIIHALNAGDIDTAMSLANPHRRGSEDGIIRALVGGYERQLHNYETQLRNAAAMLFDTDAERDVYVRRLQTLVDDARRRIDTIQERIRHSDTCSICLSEYDKKTTLPCCGNSYCFACLTRWLTSGRTPVCPMCKAPAAMRDMMVIGPPAPPGAAAPAPDAPAEDELSPEHDKLQNLEALLRQRLDASEGEGEGAAPRMKMLIFASYENTFDKIVSVLRRVRVRHGRLRGNHMVLRNVIAEYRSGRLDVLLVNARQHGCGLNLENTTDVVMFHKFDNEIEGQIVGRAQRYGRVDALRLWYLLHPNEMPAEAAQAQA